MAHTIISNGKTYEYNGKFCNDNLGWGAEYVLRDDEGDIIDSIYIYDDDYDQDDLKRWGISPE